MSPTTTVDQAPAAFQALDEGYEWLPIEQLVESKYNPRKTFDPKKLEELAASIREKSIIEPIIVRQVDAGSHKPKRFEIVAGARRFRAAKLTTLTHVPAVVRLYSDIQMVEIMAIENGQRDDVPPLEEAAGYMQLLGFDSAYSARLIAEKIGRTEKYVWERLRLLDLVDDARKLLEVGIIGVEHAEVIAKLKPADQKRVIQRRNGGLFHDDFAFEFDEHQQPGSGAYDKVKPVSLRELKQWIARNIRFDVAHAAAAAPLDFGVAAQRIEAAQALPGRGKKVVPITFEHMCPYNAADNDERTYGATAWKKAEGKDGEGNCEHAVLGVVAAGKHYGDTFHVCIARDRCTTHWETEVAQREKNQKLRDAGKPKQAAKNEKSAYDKQQEKYRREQAEQRAKSEAWDKLSPLIIADAVNQVKTLKALTPTHARYFEKRRERLVVNVREIRQELGATWFKNPAAAILVQAVADFYNVGLEDYVKEIAKPLGLNLKRLEAIRDKHLATPAPKAKAS